MVGHDVGALMKYGVLSDASIYRFDLYERNIIHRVDCDLLVKRYIRRNSYDYDYIYVDTNNGAHAMIDDTSNWIHSQPHKMNELQTLIESTKHLYTKFMDRRCGINHHFPIKANEKFFRRLGEFHCRKLVINNTSMNWDLGEFQTRNVSQLLCQPLIDLKNFKAFYVTHIN